MSDLLATSRVVVVAALVLSSFSARREKGGGEKKKKKEKRQRKEKGVISFRILMNEEIFLSNELGKITRRSLCLPLY